MILQKLKLRVGMLLLGLVSLGASSFAVSYPLNYPYGLAVDSHGNLYVANMNGNQILVYDLDHVQVPAKTITNNVNGPTGVAFDLNGNLWVTNATSSLVGEYVNGTFVGGITDGVSNPQAIAIDGLNDVLVNNSYQTLSLFTQDSLEKVYGPVYSYTIPSPNSITGLASYKGIVAVGTNTEAFLFGLMPMITGQSTKDLISPTCFGAAYDSAGLLYCANEDETLTVGDLNMDATKLANLPFFPLGIAIDNAHGLIYISGGTANKIAVYNMKGVLLTTIE
jgi:hypothetical protein